MYGQWRKGKLEPLLNRRVQWHDKYLYHIEAQKLRSRGFTAQVLVYSYGQTYAAWNQGSEVRSPMELRHSGYCYDLDAKSVHSISVA